MKYMRMDPNKPFKILEILVFSIFKFGQMTSLTKIAPKGWYSFVLNVHIEYLLSFKIAFEMNGCLFASL